MPSGKRKSNPVLESVKDDNEIMSPPPPKAAKTEEAKTTPAIEQENAVITQEIQGLLTPRKEQTLQNEKITVLPWVDAVAMALSAAAYVKSRELSNKNHEREMRNSSRSTGNSIKQGYKELLNNIKELYSNTSKFLAELKNLDEGLKKDNRYRLNYNEKVHFCTYMEQAYKTYNTLREQIAPLLIKVEELQTQIEKALQIQSNNTMFKKLQTLLDSVHNNLMVTVTKPISNEVQQKILSKSSALINELRPEVKAWVTEISKVKVNSPIMAY